MPLGLASRFDILPHSPYDLEAAPPPEVSAPSIHHWVPSRYNIRATAEDGRLVLWNSLSGKITVFKEGDRETVLRLLRKKGFEAPKVKLVSYLADRGYLVHKGADEFRQFQQLFGQQHYRTDALELILLASEDCNFRCTYCYEDFARGTMLPEVREGVKNLVRKRIRKLNRLQVSWFGGEPLYGWRRGGRPRSLLRRDRRRARRALRLQHDHQRLSADSGHRRQAVRLAHPQLPGHPRRPAGAPQPLPGRPRRQLDLRPDLRQPQGPRPPRRQVLRHAAGQLRSGQCRWAAEVHRHAGRGIPRGPALPPRSPLGGQMGRRQRRGARRLRQRRRGEPPSATSWPRPAARDSTSAPCATSPVSAARSAMPPGPTTS